ncbi:hypothetical protein F4778DRAFT_772612 [Xylariomycetidae sp. FL2044]|nr:hypothetical protein F4778DRAFT_772612 [Xylariomycetidae sp. FL2044]
MSQPYQDGSCMLSPVDQLMPRIYTTIFLVYEIDVDYDSAVRKLNEGLAKATSILPFLKGAVHKSPDDGSQPRNRLSLSWSSSQDPPLTLVETPAPQSLPSIQELKRDHAPLAVFQDALSPVSTLIDHGDPKARHPPLVVGVTRLEGGGLVLCLCAHHVVMDGGGMGLFLKLWGKCTRNEPHRPGDDDDEAPFDAGELHHRGSWLREASGYFSGAAPDATTLEALLLKHGEYSLRSMNSAPPPISTNAPGHPPQCDARIFAFSSAKLEEVKKILSLSLPVELLTVNNILGAALWLCITRVRLARMRRDGIGNNIPDSATSKLGFAANARSRLGPPVSDKSFLGNATMLKTVEFRAGELDKIAGDAMMSSSSSSGTAAETAGFLSAMGPVIRAMAAAASAVAGAHVGEILALADRLADVEDVGPGWDSTHHLDLTYTSWANLGLYEGADFSGPGFFSGAGDGRPRFVRIPYMPYLDGMVLALPRCRPEPAAAAMAVEEERIEVVVMMNERDMRVLLEDEMLRSWSWSV